MATVRQSRPIHCAIDNKRQTQPLRLKRAGAEKIAAIEKVPYLLTRKKRREFPRRKFMDIQHLNIRCLPDADRPRGDDPHAATRGHGT